VPCRVATTYSVWSLHKTLVGLPHLLDAGDELAFFLHELGVDGAYAFVEDEAEEEERQDGEVASEVGLHEEEEGAGGVDEGIEESTAACAAVVVGGDGAGCLEHDFPTCLVAKGEVGVVGLVAVFADGEVEGFVALEGVAVGLVVVAFADGLCRDDAVCVGGVVDRASTLTIIAEDDRAVGICRKVKRVLTIKFSISIPQKGPTT